MGIETISNIDLADLQEGNLIDATNTRSNANKTLKIAKRLDLEEPNQFDRRLLLDIIGMEMFTVPVSEVLIGHFGDWRFHRIYPPQGKEEVNLTDTENPDIVEKHE